MHIRNTGDESLSRKLLLRRARRIWRRRTSNTNLKHRTHPWLPTTATWLHSWLPLFPAVAAHSNITECERCSYPVHRYRNSSKYTSTASRTVSHSLHVGTLANLCLSRRLRSRSAAVQPSQARPPGRSTVAAGIALVRSVYGPLRSSTWKSTPSPKSSFQLSYPNLPIIPSAKRRRNHTSSPPSSRATSVEETALNGRRSFIPRSNTWATECSRTGRHASACSTSSGSQTQVHPRRRPKAYRIEGEEEPYLEADC